MGLKFFCLDCFPCVIVHPECVLRSRMSPLETVLLPVIFEILIEQTDCSSFVLKKITVNLSEVSEDMGKTQCTKSMRCTIQLKIC